MLDFTTYKKEKSMMELGATKKTLIECSDKLAGQDEEDEKFDTLFALKVKVTKLEDLANKHHGSIGEKDLSLKNIRDTLIVTEKALTGVTEALYQAQKDLEDKEDDFVKSQRAMKYKEVALSQS